MAMPLATIRHCKVDAVLLIGDWIRVLRLESNILNTMFYQYCPVIPSYSKFPVAIDVIGGRIGGKVPLVFKCIPYFPHSCH